MSYEPYNCVDCGSEFCPCHLAESGNCILCSHLDGKDFCDCVNWNGVCIYQEFVQNNYKAKEGRKYNSFQVISKEDLTNSLTKFKIKVTKKLASDLTYPGAFIFIRKEDKENSYDTPICVMESDTGDDIITIVIEMKGLKTKTLQTVQVGDTVLIKGPFWNGILGLNSILNAKRKNCLLICRGIGQAPMVPVMNKLYRNDNKLIVLLDKGLTEKVFIEQELERYNAKVIEIDNIIQNGILIPKCRKLIEETIIKDNIDLVHCDTTDIISYQVMKIVEAFQRDLSFSCSNNEKMCCGEGVCGCCTIMNNDEKLRRLCKMQTEPKFVFEGRRLL